MILTQCPVCAAPLPDLTAKQCSRCKTRYCGPACQKKHWEEGGHDKLCKKIKRAGGAEQYHANTKYKEAVGVAMMACAEDTRGQTCYICTEAVHRHTGEGLVRVRVPRDGGLRACVVLGGAGEDSVGGGRGEQLGLKVKSERFRRWHTCSLCEQEYHGVVRGALGWACWKTWAGGGGLALHGDERVWEWFPLQNTTRTRCP